MSTHSAHRLLERDMLPRLGDRQALVLLLEALGQAKGRALEAEAQDPRLHGVHAREGQPVADAVAELERQHMPYEHHVGVEDVAVELHGLPPQPAGSHRRDQPPHRRGRLDNGGRHVSLTKVCTAVAGTERVQCDWSFAKATPEEVQPIAPVYEWAVSDKEVDPWPNPVEADWWVRLRTLAPDLPYG